MKTLVLLASLAAFNAPTGYPQPIDASKVVFSNKGPVYLVSFVYINEQLQDGEAWGFPVEVFQTKEECYKRAFEREITTHLTLRNYCTIEHAD